MPSADRLRHAVAALAIVLGAGLLGASVGGMARMDGDLRAAAVAPREAATSFVELPLAAPTCDGHGPRPWSTREV